MRITTQSLNRLSLSLALLKYHALGYWIEQHT